jgi:hypothetical protein
MCRRPTTLVLLSLAAALEAGCGRIGYEPAVRAAGTAAPDAGPSRDGSPRPLDGAVPQPPAPDGAAAEMGTPAPIDAADDGPAPDRAAPRTPDAPPPPPDAPPAPPPDAAGAVDAERDAGTPATAGPCGKTTLAADDFNDGVRAPMWSASFETTATLAEAGGEAVVRLTGMAGEFAGFKTLSAYDLTGTGVQVEVTRVPRAGAASAAASMYVELDVDNKVQIAERGGFLYFERWAAGAFATTKGPAYDPVQHRWWRIRESAGTVSLETSPDARAWTLGLGIATPPYATAVHVVLAGGTGQTESSPGEVHFDNLNGGVAAGVWCPAAALTADFAAGLPSPEWHGYSVGGATFAASQGALVLAPVPSATSSASFLAQRGRDLTGAWFAVEVLETTNPRTTASTWLQAADERGARATITEQNGRLHFSDIGPGSTTELASVAYDPAVHRWWRLREQQGMLFWETSPNGSAWTVHWSEPSPITIRPAFAGMGVASASGIASPGQARFATFNRTP